jgi:hypothetical protein
LLISDTQLSKGRGNSTKNSAQNWKPRSYEEIVKTVIKPKEGSEDFLSNLPDVLLCEIFQCFKQAGK